MSESTGPAYAEGTGPAYNEATPYPFKPDGQPRMYTNGRDHMVILDERSGFRIATPSEIAAAFREQFHCGNCDHFCRAKSDGQEHGWGYCGDYDGPTKYDVEFCSQHSKLTDEDHTALTGAPDEHQP